MNFINELSTNIAKQMANDIDNAIFKFLNNNGYEIDNISNVARFNEIVQDLKEMDLFIDYIDLTLPQTNENLTQLKVTKVILPFFNYISNPIDKQQLVTALKEKYDGGVV